MLRLLSAILLVLVSSTIAAAQCPSMGLTLNENGDRMGDPFSITITGSPNVSGLLAIDVSPGPTVTPVGTVCLGFTPATIFSPITLSSLGLMISTGTLPTLPFLAGFTAYMQAAVADPGQPGGLAISNGDSVTLRTPRLFLFNPGMPPTPFGGGTNGSFCAYDALSDVAATGAIPLPSQVSSAIVAPDVNMLLILLFNNTLLGLDATSFAPVLNLALPTTPTIPSKVDADGDRMVVLYQGFSSPFGGGQPGVVRTFNLPSGALEHTITLASGQNPTDMIVLKGTGLAYLRIGASVVPVDLVNGNVLPAIDLVPGLSGGISEWVRDGNTLYCLMPGSAGGPFGGGGQPGALNAVDITTHTKLFPAAVTVPGNGPLGTLRYGPGPSGDALYVYQSSASSLLHISPATLTVNGALVVGAGFVTMELSNGQTEWQMLCSGAGCGGTPILQSMNPISLLITPVHPVGFIQKLIPLPSASLFKTLLVQGTDTVAAFQSDPLQAPPSSVVTLPISSGALQIVVD